MTDETPQSKATQETPPANEEQIGPLHFVSNPNYPYPFKVANPPRFWMEETTGALADAVETYMSGEPLSTQQLDLIKIYLNQFLERAVLANDANRRQLIAKAQQLRSTEDIEVFADELSEYGGEVF